MNRRNPINNLTSLDRRGTPAETFGQTSPMARPLRPIRVIAMLIASVAILPAAPAAAQFFNPFEALFGPPPRPPSSVPTNRPQPGYPQYPDASYDHRYPAPQNPAIIPRQGPPRSVATQPLPPPPGATPPIPIYPP